MAANRMPIKYRSATYPSTDIPLQSNSTSTHLNRGKLKRMDNVDNDNISSNQQLHGKIITTLPHQSHSISCSRSVKKHRNLSAEGRLRTQHFHQTHSGPSSSNNRFLRFSDGSLGLRGYSSCHSTNEHIKSSTCLPLDRSKVMASSHSASAKVERSFDGQKHSVEKLSYRPHSIAEAQHGGNQNVNKMNKTSNKKLQKFYSTESHDSNVSRTVSGENSNSSTEHKDVDGRSRRSQFRRAISLFSLSCDKEGERKEKTPQKILRPPTRHVYRRGLSGLPIECGAQSLGIAY